MICAEIADLEENVLEGADRGLRAKLWGGGDDSGEGFEDRCAGRGDEVTGVSYVPVAAVLLMLVQWGIQGKDQEPTSSSLMMTLSPLETSIP